jgi:hypothetical protein
MTGIPDYVMVFTDLEKSFQNDYVRDMVLLTMYCDLMSYLAQCYARSVSFGLTLLQPPTTVVAQLVNLLALADLAPYHKTIKIMTSIAKQVMPAPPPPTRQQPVRRSRFSCAVTSAPPDGYVLPSSSDTEDDEEGEDEDDDNAAKAAEDDDYEEDAYSTHSTPKRRTSTSSLRDTEYVQRRLSHPGNRPAQAPSPMRPSKMMSPLGRRTSPSTMTRKPLRSPQTIIPQLKQSSPQQVVPDAIESSPVSPLRLEKSCRSSSSPKEEQIQNPEGHDEALNLLQINAGHRTFNSLVSD